MNGNIMRVSRMVRAAFSYGKPGARILISTGAKKIPSRVIALMNTSVRVATLLASFQADASPSFAIRREKVVTKAVESAPSAKRSRSMFGARNAVKNASMFQGKARQHCSSQACRPHFEVADHEVINFSQADFALHPGRKARGCVGWLQRDAERSDRRLIQSRDQCAGVNEEGAGVTVNGAWHGKRAICLSRHSHPSEMLRQSDLGELQSAR